MTLIGTQHGTFKHTGIILKRITNSASLKSNQLPLVGQNGSIFKRCDITSRFMKGRGLLKQVNYWKCRLLDYDTV